MNKMLIMILIALLMLLNGINGAVVEMLPYDMDSIYVEDDGAEPRPDPCIDPAGTCSWVGTASFCRARCPPGWSSCKIDPCAEGTQSCCVTGTKYYCCRIL